MRVLVVEDDHDLRSEIVRYLTRRDHQVVDCDSIAEARRALAEMGAAGARADAVVCDAGLPDGDGVDLYFDVAPSMPGCRWLLMSGGHDYGELTARLAASHQVPPLIIDKPISLRELHQLLSTPEA